MDQAESRGGEGMKIHQADGWRIHGESQSQCIAKEVEPEVIVPQWTCHNREGRMSWPVGELPQQK